MMIANGESGSPGAALAAGSVTADEWGLVTLKNVRVTKGRNRLRITAR